MQTPRRATSTWFALVCSLFCLATILAEPTPAQNAALSLPKSLPAVHWRSIGPYRGGRVLPITGVRGQPETYYFGAVGGGVWKTDDAGRTWNPIFDSQPVASIGAIAVAPSDPQTLYVGSGESDMRSSISTGNGMYKSIDGGKTWSHIGLENTHHIARILVDPEHPNRLFVAALGHAYGPNPERGIFRSTDGGAHWQRILFKDENTGAIDITFVPGDKQTLYAALWQTRRPPWSIYPPSDGPGSGLYRSTDGGDHWEPVTGHGLPAEGLGRMGIAIAPSNPQRVYLVVDAKEGGLYRSDDSAQTWKRVSSDKRIWQRGWYFGELTVDPKNPDTVYVPSVATFRSHDGGATFEAWKGAPGGDDYHALWIDPDSPNRMILGCDQGAIVTRNSGETWSSWFNQPTGQFYHVITDNQFPYMVYGAQQDSGSAAISSRGQFRTLNTHDWRPVEAGDENGYIAPDPLHPGEIYGGFVTRENLNTQETQSLPPTLAHNGLFRRTWTLPLVFSPTDPHVLYFSSQVLFRTADAGNTWQAISADQSREGPGNPPNLDPTTAADAPAGKRRGVIYTIAPSPARVGEIWTGTDDGLIHLTRDEGKTWLDVSPPDLTAWSKVTHIEASHSDPATAYAAVDRHRLDDLNPYLYRTQDFGKTWTPITHGIPDGSFLNCIREDPARKGLLYACTETGVYISFNNGDAWQSLQLNMPTTSIRDLVIHGDDLVVATFGRSFWILDDTAPLRELDANLDSAGASRQSWLFRPAAAYRVRPGSDQGTPVPMDEPLSANPPDGAVFDFYLKEKSAEPVTLEILDAQGQSICRISSDDQLQHTEPASVSLTMNWLHEPEALPHEPGMHRFVWNLHAALPPNAPKSRRVRNGPLVVPGHYTVRLTAAGETHEQPLFIKADPRSKATQQALQSQFALASQLTADLSEISNAAQQARTLRTQIEDRKKSTGAAANSLDDMDQKLGALLDPGPDDNLSLLGLSLPGKQDSLPGITSALTTLFSVVESADAAPTSDAAKSAKAWRAAAQDALARWKVLSSQRPPE